MKNDERNGLIILIAFLLVSSVLCTLTTGGGQSFGNIFMNMVSSEDVPRTPAVVAPYAPIMQQVNTYALIGTVADVVALVTLVAIFVFVVRRRHLPPGWCILLLTVGAVASYLILAAQNILAAIFAIPPTPISSDARFSSVLGVSILSILGIIGIVFAVIGLVLSVWALIRRRRTA